MGRRFKKQFPAVSLARSPWLMTMSGHFRTACAAGLLFALPIVADAQYNCTTNNGRISITQYYGPGGAVIIPDTINGLPVTSIDSDAFYNCASLTGVTITNGVTSIGVGAFYGCGGLTNVTLGKNVTNIGDYAFYYCTSLTAITVDASNSVYSSVAGVLFDKGQTTLIQCPAGKAGSYTIPGSVTNLGSGAFYYCSNLTGVTISNGLISIGTNTFQYCASLTNVAIPKSVAGIGSGVFSWCPSLAAITVDALNSFYSSADGVLFDKKQTTLIACPGARTGSYTISNGVASIGSSAFNSCRRLTGVTIPNGVTSIGSFAFNGCAGLAAVTIPNGVTSIESSAFNNCGAMTNVSISDSVTNIGSSAFNGCSNLASVAIPNGVTSIGYSGFSYCISLASVTIPNSVTRIGDLAFYGCASLAGVVIPGSVLSIGDWAFSYCGRLASVTIPNSTTNIGTGAFYYCTNLTSVTIPNGLQSIGDWTFGGCSSLPRIIVPGSVTNIGIGAFYYCGDLTGVYFQGNASSVGSSAFSGNNNAAVYYLPGTTGWSPRLLASGDSFGVRSNQFGFTITGVSGIGAVVEACADLTHPAWLPVGTNILADGSSYFSDPQWKNYHARFYRLRGSTLGGLQTVLWNPQVQSSGANFGVRSNRFGFTITGTSGIAVVVEACADLAHPAWSPVGTNTLAGGLSYFSDAQWKSYPSRFYRLRAP
jgi:hypothetical protein